MSDFDEHVEREAQEKRTRQGIALAVLFAMMGAAFVFYVWVLSLI